jgi:hypothetical protein
VSTRRYDVAISFAGEDRAFAEALADALRSRGVTVFYDAYEKAALWGKNLYTHLSDVYSSQARYAILLLSQHYAKKVWTRHEREAAQARAFEEHSEYILPVRLDDTAIPGVLPTVGYLRWPPEDANSIADAVVAKLGPGPASAAPTRSPPASFGSAIPVYCATCGATPGNSTKCTTGYSHNFVSRNEPVYCSTCGALPGKSSKCTTGYSHNFVRLNGPTYCATCGAMPGASTKCTTGYSHSFVGLNGPTYCATCGVMPGASTKCTTGYSHNFVRR